MVIGFLATVQRSGSEDNGDLLALPADGDVAAVRGVVRATERDGRHAVLSFARDHGRVVRSTDTLVRANSV